MTTMTTKTAAQIIRECARQSYTADAERTVSRSPEEQVRAWRAEAADHGDTAVVEAIDEMWLDDAVMTYRDAVEALRGSDGASTM